jgi:raffinose/stachyose/melibiose transport system substrate-binding protein
MKTLRILVLAAMVLGIVGAVFAAQTANAQDEVTIEWWHISTEEPQAAYWQALADEYTAMHPNVTINITVLENEAFKSRLVTVMQSGEPPDLFQSWGGGVLWTFADAGLVRNIAPELEGEWKDSFSAQAALELYGQNGEYYGVPWTWGAVGMFYNKALFAQAGLDPDNPPATWDEFLAAVQALKDAGITPIALGEGDRWPGHFWWVYLAIRLGGQDAFLKAYTREGSFSDEPFVQAGEYLKQLVDMEPFQEGFLGVGYGDEAALMGNAQAAMELMGQWAPAVQAGNSESGEGIGEDLGWFPFPVIPGGAGNPNDVLGGGDGFAVGRDAPDEAVDFLKFITSVDAQRRGAELWIVPTVKGAEDVVSDDPIMSRIIAARNEAPYFQLYYDQFLPPAIASAVLDATAGLFAGTLSPEDAAALIEDEASLELD